MLTVLVVIPWEEAFWLRSPSPPCCPFGGGHRDAPGPCGDNWARERWLITGPGVYLSGGSILDLLDLFMWLCLKMLGISQ